MKENVTLTPSQQKAKELFDMGESLFLTGKAGTGKSFLVSHIMEEQQARRHNVVVCAPTGVAAINVGGATLHRTFKLPTSIIEPYRRCRDKNRLKMLASADVVVVDEISMCRQDMFTAMMNTLDRAWGSRGAKKKRKQLLLVGDFHQLPPVLTPREEDLYRNFYDGLFPFQSERWAGSGIRTHTLTENMRQSDARFMEMLDNVRDGIADFGCLERCVTSRADPGAISLCTTNRAAEEINTMNLGRISGNGVVFEGDIAGVVAEGDKPVPDVLCLKVGARVMSVVNDDEGYSNGSLGTVVDIREEEKTVSVKFDYDGKVRAVKPHEWSVYDYGLEQKTLKDDFFGSSDVEAVTKKKIGSYSQIPLKLAWAVTVHKSQGQTYDRVNIYGADRFFAPGQLYVALSRCRTLEGINLVGRLSPQSLIRDDDVVAFMSGNKEVPQTTLFY